MELESILLDWIMDVKVVGGTIFGCSVENARFEKGKKELEVSLD